ncbi:flagellin [Algimonas ampicilliniresistens]|jgi:flagellar hook-associated protein 3 FlgL|uniref:Flagellin n=1 Tax=Algimonas ampicilliniresistens TaxID=1298735 RepID=A0ABQ5V9W5_9PROT|nr:flagellin [Algimonas ampicilliniresistens]GLQ24341.1 flagellin [Algimonas ampicilliniresistens]
MRFSLTPDTLFQTRQARLNADLRARLQTVGQEAITGRRSDQVQATSGRLGDAFLLEKAALDITRQRDTANLASARLDGAASSVSTIRTILTSFAPESRNTLAQGQPSDIALLGEKASDTLQQVMGALSRRQGTRHLFSGTHTVGGPLAVPADLMTAVNAQIAAAPNATDAITAVNDYFNIAGGGFETDIYQGSVEEGPRLHVTDTRSYDPLPKGDDPIFRDIMRGFAMIAGAENAVTTTDRDALMEEGLAVLDTALSGVLAMESRLGSAQESIERIDTSLQTEAALVSSALDKMLGRDVFDAAAELQALEGQLEASYTVTGRLGSLSLANFLR